MIKLIITICATVAISGCSSVREIGLTKSGQSIRPEGTKTFITNGGWCWFQDERAIMQGNKLVVGAIAGKGAGDVKVATYDMNESKHLGTAILRANFERDDHNAPVFCALPNGQVLTVYEEHFLRRDPHHYFRISAPNDTSKWEPEYKHKHDKTHVTYANLYYVPKEKRIYNFFRHGRIYSPFFFYSDDLGKTWSKNIQLIDDGNRKRRNRPYARYCFDGVDTFHITFTDGHPRVCSNNVYYVKFKDGKFYKANGEFIKDLHKDGPMTPQEAEMIYKGGCRDNRGWTSSIRLDEKGYPVIGNTNYISNDDHRYFYVRWDGTKWHKNEIAFGGSCFWKHENDYTGLITIDPTDTNTVYISTNVDPVTGKKVGTGKHEIYQGYTKDFGVNWSWKAITANSSKDNIRPVVVPSNGKHYALLWLRGSFPSFIEYDLDVVGVVKEL